MCCNGVLFGDVELRAGDDARRLASLGLDLFRKDRHQAFAQPCSCFDGKFCNIYADRPKRCRTFECRLLQRTQAEELTTAEALKKIKLARKQVEAVRQLVRQLGHTDERVPLNRRYAEVMEQPIDLAADDQNQKVRGQLMRAVEKLSQILERDFLT
jgi:hypothetical protein